LVSPVALQESENHRRFSPSLLMVKEEGLLQRRKGERQWGKFPCRCKKKGGYWMQKNKLHTHNTASLPIIAPYIDTLKTHQIQIGISKIILLRKCAFSLDFYNPNFLLFEY
jgi:hypothetical protein